MNIALVGYGNMGKLLEARAREQGHRIVAIIDPCLKSYAAESSAGEAPPVIGASVSGTEFPACDIALEFTRPETAPENLLALAALKIPALCGTTGWYDRLPEAVAAVEKAGSSLLWASNFSLGINLFYRIAEYAAKIFDPFPGYDAGGFEIHHNRKADSPSGTAKTLAEKVIAQMSRKNRAVYETLREAPAPDTLHFGSVRAGSVPGTHTLFFDSAADTVEITHTARSREGFAAGAIRAAEWLFGRGSGIFTMDDVLADILAAGS